VRPRLKRGSSAAALLIAAALVGGCGAGGSPAQDPMPGDGFLDIWSRDGEPLVFPGAELYGHINGGAEVFLELGFERLEVQRYASVAGEIAVELYRMSDPAAALGIYLMKCGAETADPSLVARHTVGPRQLQMLHGEAYVSVNAMRSDDDLEPSLVGFARHLAEHLPGGDATGIFAELPPEGRLGGSERVIRGPFTLEALYTLGDGDILELAGGVTAVAAQYQDGSGERHTVIVARYPDTAAAGHAFQHLTTNLDPYLEVVSSEAARLVFSDYAGKFGEVTRDGDALRIRVHLTESPE